MFRTRLFQATVWLLLVFAVIWLGQQISFVFRPVVLITTIFLPFLLAGFLYYLTDPVVSALQRLRLPRAGAIAVVYILLGGLLLAAVLWLVPVFERQLVRFVGNIPSILRQLDSYIHEFQQSKFFPGSASWGFFSAGAKLITLSLWTRSWTRWHRISWVWLVLLPILPLRCLRCPSCCFTCSGMDTNSHPLWPGLFPPRTGPDCGSISNHQCYH